MPPIFALLHPKFATPWVAILTSSLLTLILNFFNFYHIGEVFLCYSLSNLQFIYQILYIYLMLLKLSRIKFYVQIYLFYLLIKFDIRQT